MAMDISEALMKVGFTRHEAALYITLCGEGELTGYEAAKLSGIPRSNAYLALAGLVEKGAAYKIEGNAMKYIAVPGTELAENIRRETQSVLDYIKQHLPEPQKQTEPFITIVGETHIVNKMNNIIHRAESRVYVSMAAEELEYIREPLAAAMDRGLKVVVITSPGCRMEGALLYHSPKQPGQIRIIADGAHVLTGELTTTCLYSENQNLIQLIKDSLVNEIKLIELTSKELGNA